jgi:hypothetical protein
MITLVRRIRKKLIDSGSVTKYLLYAIDFFSNQDTPAYRLLMQSAGWSVSILTDRISVNEKIMKRNGDLIQMISPTTNK